MLNIRNPGFVLRVRNDESMVLIYGCPQFTSRSRVRRAAEVQRIRRKHPKAIDRKWFALRYSRATMGEHNG